MRLIFNLSLRNLLRQKKRNIFLGTGIAFGMMILVIANSFSAGLVDVIFNDVITYVAGHVTVMGTQGKSWMPMIRDKERVIKAIEDAIPKEDLITTDENLGMFSRAIGNGEVDNLVLVGVEAQEGFFEEFFTNVDGGNFEEYTSEEIEYPVIISKEKAKSLNVSLYDTINVRFPMVTGQIQTASLTVIAIANANNSFMNMVTFLEAKRLKKLLGYKPYESSDIQVTIKNPKVNAKIYADKIYQNLKPEILAFQGNINSNEEVIILGYGNEDSEKKFWKSKIDIVEGDRNSAFEEDGLMINKSLSMKLGLISGDKFTLNYKTKYKGIFQKEFQIDAIFDSEDLNSDNIILTNEEKIFLMYSKNIPQNTKWDYFSKGSSFYKNMGTEWKQLERTSNAAAFQKKHKNERKNKSETQKIDVTTMYETASQILQMEGVLNLLTIVAVMVLFFIILIGVINTLRMTIKERTKEIGTIRAIGMQKKDIRRMFVMETLLLTLFSCIVGTLLGIIITQLLGMIEFNSESVLSMILKDKRINFKIEFVTIITNIVVISVISVFTAFFPANRAAKLSAAESLRHYE